VDLSLAVGEVALVAAGLLGSSMLQTVLGAVASAERDRMRGAFQPK